MRLKRLAGQGLPEYSLIVGLIAVPGVAAIVMLSGSVDDLFANMITRSSGGNAAVAAPPSGGGTGGATGGTSTGGAPSTTGDGISASGPDVEVTLADGTTIKLSNYPSDLQKSLATTGANGTTNLLLANIDSVKKALEESGTLTPEQSNLLAALANQGHRIGDIVGALEGQLADHGDNPDQFRNTPITFDNYQFTDITDLAGDIGYSDVGGPTEGSEIMAMRDLYQQAASAGAFKDPAVEKTVGTLMEQIFMVANGMETATYNYASGAIDKENFQENATNYLYERERSTGIVIEPLTGPPGSEVVHDNSNGICAEGGPTGSCTR